MNDNAYEDSDTPDLSDFKNQACQIADATQKLWQTMLSEGIEREDVIATLREQAQTKANECLSSLEARTLYHEALKSNHFLNDIFLRQWVQLANLEAKSDNVKYTNLELLQEKIDNSPLNSFAHSFYVGIKQELIIALTNTKNEGL